MLNRLRKRRGRDSDLTPAASTPRAVVVRGRRAHGSSLCGWAGNITTSTGCQGCSADGVRSASRRRVGTVPARIVAGWECADHRREGGDCRDCGSSGRAGGHHGANWSSDARVCGACRPDWCFSGGTGDRDLRGGASIRVTALDGLGPPVAGHPSVELGDGHGSAGLHDERFDASRSPVVEVCTVVSSAWRGWTMINVPSRPKVWPSS